MSGLEGRKTVTVEIGGGSYVLIPDFAAAMAIESAVNLTIFEVTQAAFKQGIGIVSVIIFQAIKANKDNDAKMLTLNQVGQAVTEDYSTNERALFHAALEFLNEYYPKDTGAPEKKPDGQ